MARRRYDIVLHMFDEQDVLPIVDPRYYTFQKLLDDIGRCRLIPEGVVDTIFFDIYVDCEDKNERIHVVCDEDVIEMFHRNVVTAEVHVWIHAELITPLGAELHVIDLDAEVDVQTDGVEAEGVDQEAESVDKEAESANETHVEDDENAMHDECDSARGAGQTNEDEDDGLMSGYSSDDAPLDEVSENEGDEDEGEDEDEDEPEDPMKIYLHRNMYEGAEGEDQKIHLEEGMIFENVDKFREVLREYVVQEGFVIVRLKNERTRVTCKCAADGCSWRIHASPLSDKITFAIKSLKAEHTCVRVKTMKEANSSWMSKKLLQVLRENPDMKARGIRHELQKYGIDPPYMQLYRAKKKLLSRLMAAMGTHTPNYLIMLRWVYLNASMIWCHAINRRCARHLFANFKQHFSGMPLKKYFWQACRSYNEQGFNSAMKKIQEFKPAAVEWLMKIDVSMWARHAFPVDLKNDHVTNNIAESFNAWIGEFRGKPIMTLLEGVRTKVMNMVHKRHEKGLKWTKEIMPNILKKANEQMEWSRHCNLHVASQTEFEVLDKNRDNIEVYIDRSFSKEKYMMAYTHVIHPIPDVKFWKNLDDVQPSTILHPPLRRLPGRPRKSRRKETGEQSNVKPGLAMRCTICHEIGHNKRTCQRTTVGASQRNKSKKNIRRNKRNAQIDIEADVPLSQVLENMSRNKRSRQSQTSSAAIAEEMPYIPQPPPSA
ncbi:hypothetical protein Sango_2258400 [Sesamum angolense]|uniref:Transposase MuDR plant domain-containing protein n=1 Tax=Sesamum angolense TaxID=2727404 RepID=A0AAE1W9F9_9LAMI|nr:hypothetical protein Sango_2258400 [Sesamum angolense]